MWIMSLSYFATTRRLRKFHCGLAEFRRRLIKLPLTTYNLVKTSAQTERYSIILSLYCYTMDSNITRSFSLNISLYPFPLIRIILNREVRLITVCRSGPTLALKTRSWPERTSLDSAEKKWCTLVDPPPVHRTPPRTCVSTHGLRRVGGPTTVE